MTDYLRFLTENRRFLAFGLMLTAVSSFGQTFFISLFGGELRATFELSNGGFGTIYAVANLASAATLPWVGRWIDRMNLTHYSLLVAIGLILSCWLLSAAAGIVWLAAALYGLRLCGQGLMPHTATTSMARYYAQRRGTAISIANMGLPLGEAVLPTVAVALAAMVDWRTAWVIFGAVVAVFVLPAIPLFMKGHDARHERYLAEQAQVAEGLIGGAGRLWRRREVLRDPGFFIGMPVVLAAPFIGTGFFFHQVPLVESKGWSQAWFASTFAIAAVCSVTASLVTGPILDRFGARRILPCFLLPLAAGLVCVARFDGAWAAPVFMAGVGLSAGASGIVMAALWAELYGTANLGAIRSMVTALMVLATGLSPALFGWLLDIGVSMEAIAIGCVCGIAAAIGVLGLRGSPAREPRRA